MFIQLSLSRVKQNKNNITIVINLVFTTQVCKKTVRFKMFVDCVNKGLVSKLKLNKEVVKEEAGKEGSAK